MKNKALKLIAATLFTALSGASQAGGWSWECHNIYSDPVTKYNTTCLYEASEVYKVFVGLDQVLKVKHLSSTEDLGWANRIQSCRSGYYETWEYQDYNPIDGYYTASMITYVPNVGNLVDTKEVRTVIGEDCGMEWKSSPPYYPQEE